MQEIKPAYVTFEQAEKFKEKGFNNPVRGLYDNQYIPAINTELRNWNEFEGLSAPEQWQVVEWLRITHDIHITYGCDYNWKLKEYRGKAKFYYIINFDLLDSLDKNLEPKFLFDTPQEAYSTAFDYILKNNLI